MPDGVHNSYAQMQRRAAYLSVMVVTDYDSVKGR